MATFLVNFATELGRMIKILEQLKCSEHWEEQKMLFCWWWNIDVSSLQYAEWWTTKFEISKILETLESPRNDSHSRIFYWESLGKLASQNHGNFGKTAHRSMPCCAVGTFQKKWKIKNLDLVFLCFCQRSSSQLRSTGQRCLQDFECVCTSLGQNRRVPHQSSIGYCRFMLVDFCDSSAKASSFRYFTAPQLFEKLLDTNLKSFFRP